MTQRAWPRLDRGALVLAVLAGLASGTAAWLWADRPSWRNNDFGGCEPGGFNRDGTELVTFHGIEPSKGFKPCRIRWDVATGRPIAVTPIAWNGLPLEAHSRFFLADAPGGERMFVGIFSGLSEAGRNGFHFYIHDTITGRRTAGPLNTLHILNDAFCSADGRRFLTLQHNDRYTFDALTIWDVDTCAKPITLHFSDRADVRPCWAVLSPDGEQVAVLWNPPQPTASSFVQLYDLTSGGEARRLDLRSGLEWSIGKKWREDGRLYAVAVEPTKTSSGEAEQHLRRRWLSLAENDFGAERVEELSYDGIRPDGSSIYWYSGPGWVARAERIVQQEPVWRPWVAEVARRLGADIGPFTPGRRVTVTDAVTGAVRGDLRSVSGVCHIAPNGRWVAGLDTERGVEMWDAHRTPPWVWSVTAGMIGFGTVLSVGWFRRALPPMTTASAAAANTSTTARPTPLGRSGSGPATAG
ncbi:MAG TPA: hypothetical protein VL371_24005 [Gemmataceae bacterium]|nr:hypothetical protein [Gemmataceae bacterium]